MELSGLEPVHIGADTLFVNIGERTNVTGSKAFARMILNGEYEQALVVARQQVENGAQIIDINMDEAMLDSQAATSKRGPQIETSKGYVDGKTARSHVSTDRVLKGKVTP